MLFDARQGLEERIVAVLAEHPNSSANVLLKHVAKKKRYSIQGLYKELRKLELNGVIVKSGSRYSLRIPWVLEYTDFAKNLNDRYVTSAQTILQLPTKSKKQIHHFSDLLQLNNYWSHVLLFLVQETQEKILLSYMPHPWYHLVYTEQERQYVESLQRVGAKLYILNRGKTYLDQWAERFWKEPYIEYSLYAKAFPRIPGNTYLNAIGDYVITVKLSPEITKEIEKLYTQTITADDVNYAEIFRIFHQRARATLWLEKNPNTAKKIRGVFTRHFGVGKKC